MKAADVPKEVNIQSLDVLTDSEYLNIIENADHGTLGTDSEELEELEPNESDFSPAALRRTLETHSKRSRKFPKHLLEISHYLA